MNVAIFPATSEVGLEVNRALKHQKDINVIGVAAEEHEEYTKIVYCPYIWDVDFVNYIDKINKQQYIDHWILTNELALEALPHLSIHNKDAISVCNDKLTTYERLKHIVPCPSLEGQLPVFIKPRKGHSGIGCRVEQSMEYTLSDNEIEVEYLPGDEYTIDCFSQNNELIYSQPRKRERTQAGISVKTTYHSSFELITYANAINKELKMNGAWFFQMKKDKKGQLKLLEVACRIAGSSALSRLNGVNLPLMECYLVQGESVEANLSKKITTVTRSLNVKTSLPLSYNKLYIDLDDTLIINGKVNHEIIALIYKYEWEKVVLITRSKLENVRRKLEWANISVRLFSYIQCCDKDPKSQYIEDYSVFIDDSYVERTEVESKRQVYAIEPSVVSAFI